MRLLNDLELATILAALRLVQDRTDLTAMPQFDELEDEAESIDDEFIDQLCEDINGAALIDMDNVDVQIIQVALEEYDTGNMTDFERKSRLLNELREKTDD